MIYTQHEAVELLRHLLKHVHHRLGDRGIALGSRLRITGTHHDGVNDDETDNYFLDMVSRFPDVEEDEPPYRLIVPDYAKL